ncbi:hypothetical protein MFLO_11829 [Listeria floridensis FSL S10-1187]|uniref:Modifier protein of major autolysin LytC n=1 Tax=Listeria floridensis FSL S10-1187 TaxID=1265817 RepID=A0ABN0RDB9_9LIST|nr:hypothetical protein MFLO_11829 [Listeria floridensis FSL S10-1187]
MADKNITEINLTNDIYFPSEKNVYTDVRVTHSVTINGNNNTIYVYKSSMNGQLDGANTVTFNDVNIVANPEDGFYSYYGLVLTSVPDYTINLNNVNYYGPQAIYNPRGNVNVSGNTTLTSTRNHETMEVKNLTVKSGANAKFTTNKGNSVRGYYSGAIILEDNSALTINSGTYAFLLDGTAPVTIGKNAVLNTSSNYSGISVPAGTLSIKDGAKVDIKSSSPTINVPQVNVKNINVGKASTFNVTSSATSAYAIRTNTGTLQFFGDANYDINNLNRTGRALYMPASSINLNGATVGAWNKDNMTDAPDLSWDAVVGSIKMSGYVTPSANTSDDNLNANFKAQNYHRIASVAATAPTLVVNTINEDAKVVSGTATPGSNVTILVNGKTYETVASSSGTFSVAIDPAAKEGDVFKVTASKGNKEATQTLTVKDVTAPDAPVVEGSIMTTSTTISGTAEPNSTVEAKVNGIVIGSTKADANGNYTINIPKQAKGVSIAVTATDAAGNTSKATTVKVVETNKDYKLTVNSYNLGQTTLTGTYGKDVSKVRLFVNGVVVLQATTNNGTYTFNNVANLIKDGDKIEVVAVDSAYAEVNRVEVAVKGELDTSLTANTYTIGQSLTGTYGKDVSKVRLWVNGAVAAQATTNADGTYTFPTAGSLIKAGDKVEVVAVDSKYVEVNRITVEIPAANETTLTADSYEAGQTNLTGKFSSDIAKVRLWVNGVVVTQAVLNSDGTYSFPNASALIKDGDKVEVVGVDSKYVEVKRITVDVKSSSVVTDYSLTADTYNYGDPSLSGTAGKDVFRVRLWVNGAVATQATPSENGTYSFTNAANLIKAGDKVEVVAIDSTYKEVARLDATPIDNSSSAINTPGYTLGSYTLDGTAGPDVAYVRLWINDKVVTQRIPASDGTFSFAISEGQIKAGDKVELVGVDSRYAEISRTLVTVK